MLVLAFSSAVTVLAANMAKLMMDQTHCCKMLLGENDPSALRGIHAVLQLSLLAALQ